MKKNRVCISEIELNSLRNRAELWLYLVCVIINFAVISLSIIYIGYLDRNSIVYYIALGYLFVKLILSFGSTFSATRLNSVKISGEQFEDIFEIVYKYAKVLGLKKIPDVYVKQNSGALTTFSSSFFFKNYIMISSDVFEVAYLEEKDLDAISFIIVHEMAHIAYNHTKIWFNAGILISKYIPFLYPALSRSMEYSCDNVAKKICPEGIHGIFILLLGKHLYKSINIDSYLKQSKNTHGWFEFYGNLKSTHPVPVRRIAAIYGVANQRIF